MFSWTAVLVTQGRRVSLFDMDGKEWVLYWHHSIFYQLLISLFECCVYCDYHDIIKPIDEPILVHILINLKIYEPLKFILCGFNMFVSFCRIAKGSGYKSSELESLVEDETLAIGGKEIQVPNGLLREMYWGSRPVLMTVKSS